MLRYGVAVILLVSGYLAGASELSGQEAEAVKKTRLISRDQVREEIKKWGGAEGFLRESTRGIAATSPVIVNEFTEILGAEGSGLQQTVYMSLRTLEKRAFLENESAVRAGVSNMLRRGCEIPVNSVLINEFDVTLRIVVSSKNKEYLFELMLNRKACNS